MKDRLRAPEPELEGAVEDEQELELLLPQPGRRTLTMNLLPWRGAMPPAVQLAAAVPAPALWDDLSGGAIHAVAAAGTSGAGGALPHLEAIQRAFGHHDVTGVVAHVGGAAAEAAGAIGARAYAAGDHVAFAGAPDLHLAAHEAAHVVQQRGGVRLSDGIGRSGDGFERHADEVADRVVRGESAEALLDQHAHRGAAGGPAVQRQEDPAPQQPAARQPAGDTWTEQQIRDLVQRGPAPAVIEQIAARDTANGLALLASTRLWASVLMAHPRGRAVPDSTRAAMYSMVHRRLVVEDQYRQLFWVRFDVRFERIYDQSAANRGDTRPRPMPPWNHMVGDRIWWQLDHLPDQDVSENDALEVVRAAVNGANAGEYRDDRDAQAINREVAVIREDDAQTVEEGRAPGVTDEQAAQDAETALADTVRHEIGHAVHERRRSVVDPWIQSTVRFTVELVSLENVTALIHRLGGFPTSFDEAKQRTVVQVIFDWAAGRRPWPLGWGQRAESEEQRLLQEMPETVRSLGSQRDADHGNPAMYAATSRGREFFNAYYHTLGCLGETGMEVVTATGRRRAGYAPPEFFAECYAEYYADPAAARDPARRGGSLPGWAKQFLDQHVAGDPPRGPR